MVDRLRRFHVLNNKGVTIRSAMFARFGNLTVGAILTHGVDLSTSLAFSCVKCLIKEGSPLRIIDPHVHVWKNDPAFPWPEENKNPPREDRRPRICSPWMHTALKDSLSAGYSLPLGQQLRRRRHKAIPRQVYGCW